MRWEYRTARYETGGWTGGKIENDELDQLLNAYGAEGWELVNVFGTNRGEGRTRDVVAVFKRPRS
jgi:hypothetical protein